MLIKKLTYTDYDGNERTETFYFNLSRSEITELLMGSEVPPRKSFIHDHASDAALDI